VRPALPTPLMQVMKAFAELLVPLTISQAVSYQVRTDQARRAWLTLQLGTTQDGPKYSLEGLLDSKYNITQNVEDASIARQDIVWSPCGSPVPLNINNRITLTSTNDAGYGYIQSDGNLAANLIWRKCT
jgi:hypothetical protein